MPESKDKKMASKYHTWVAGTRNLACRPGNSEVKKVKPQKPESGEDTKENKKKSDSLEKSNKMKTLSRQRISREQKDNS